MHSFRSSRAHPSTSCSLHPDSSAYSLFKPLLDHNFDWASKAAVANTCTNPVAELEFVVAYLSFAEGTDAFKVFAKEQLARLAWSCRLEL